MKETLEKRADWSLVITRTEEVIITDPVQQFILARSIFEQARQEVKKHRKIMKESEADMIKYAKASWLLIGNVTEDGKKKRLHKLELDSEIEFDEERGDQIFLHEADAISAWFAPKKKYVENSKAEEAQAEAVEEVKQ